ncbi:MAG: site-2 protease family protein [Bryobacterales bacterium]|nr:site-2 protease family protein [Bryobacterales bacterium]
MPIEGTPRPGWPPQDSAGGNASGPVWRTQTRPRRLWLHILLLLLTLVSTTAVGARMAENFRTNRPPVYLAEDLGAYQRLLSHPGSWLHGLAFSLTLLTILLAHEMGHYLACLRYGLDASLPYFMPFPSLIGTLGAFIRIRSPIYSRQVLFDVGIAGPLAGFALVVPAAIAGMAGSRVVPGIGDRGDLNFGTPALFWLLQAMFFPGTEAADLSLHPVARAAWVGVFATALNLLPIGQLDGGHILYSFIGDRHRQISRVLSLALCLLYVRWPLWLFWGLLLFFLGSRHPYIFDPLKLDTRRTRLGVVALIMFLLCFMDRPLYW